MSRFHSFSSLHNENIASPMPSYYLGIGNASATANPKGWEEREEWDSGMGKNNGMRQKGNYSAWNPDSNHRERHHPNGRVRLCRTPSRSSHGSTESRPTNFDFIRQRQFASLRRSE